MPPREFEQLNMLLSALSKGDASALDKIYILLGKRMYALAYGFAKNRADAEDILSESFLKIARSISTFRTGTNGYAWVMRVVRSCSLDFLRKRKRVAVENIDDFFHLADERYSPERRAQALIFQEAIGKLPEDLKRMIYYRYYLDFTVREIAADTGMSKSAVQRAMDRAEELLKSYLQAGQKED